MLIVNNRAKAVLGGFLLAFSCVVIADDVGMLRGKPSKEQIIQALSGGGRGDEASPRVRTRGLAIGNAAAVQDASPGAKQTTARALDLEIQFDYNSHKLTQDGMDVLDQLGEALQSDELRSARRIVLEGHTDAKGSASYNRLLSLRRAQSVRQYLASNHRIAGGKMKAVGKGFTELADPDNPEDGINRRVRIILED
jgi:outer membrane protein OmpA-like peptidoglycan-associated protein